MMHLTPVIGLLLTATQIHILTSLYSYCVMVCARSLSLFQEGVFAGHPFNSFAHQVHRTHPQGALHFLRAHTILTLVAVLLTG